MENELAVLGAALLLAGLFARVGRRLGLPTIPFFIVAGIVFGPQTPGIVVLEDPEEIHLLAMLGLVLLLFHLGIEFSINELLGGGRRLLWAGGSYIALNFGAGLVLGWALGWGTREIFVIAGMIGTSSTAIVTKLILDLRRVANPETGMILGIIVVEDVFLAFYLALLQPILGEQEGAAEIVLSTATAFAFLLGLFALARWGARLVRPVISTGDAELTVILVVGFGVFVAGFADSAGASDAVGALLAGMVVAGTGIGPRVERLLVPLRDTFAAIFFFWFGLTIAPSDMGAIAPTVAVAVVVTLAFNVIAGVVAARIYGYGRTAAANTALMLVSRGEFELILASLAVAAGLDSRVAPFAALYVLVLSILSPLFSARSFVLAQWLPRAAVRTAARARDGRRPRAFRADHRGRRDPPPRCRDRRVPGAPRRCRRRRARARPRAAARRARQRDRPRRRSDRAARLDADPRRRPPPHPRAPGGREGGRRAAGAMAPRPDRSAAAAPPQAPRLVADLHGPPRRAMTRSSATSTPPSASSTSPSSLACASAAIAPERWSPSRTDATPSPDRSLIAGSRDDVTTYARRRAESADPDDRAWLQTVVGALAIDIFDAARVMGFG